MRPPIYLWPWEVLFKNDSKTLETEFLDSNRNGIIVTMILIAGVRKIGEYRSGHLRKVFSELEKRAPKDVYLLDPDSDPHSLEDSVGLCRQLNRLILIDVDPGYQANPMEVKPIDSGEIPDSPAMHRNGTYLEEALQKIGELERLHPPFRNTEKILIHVSPFQEVREIVSLLLSQIQKKPQVF